MTRADDFADDLVEQWHKTPWQADHRPLHVFMRLDWVEYKTWVETSVLPDDFLSRHRHVHLLKLLDDETTVE